MKSYRNWKLLASAVILISTAAVMAQEQGGSRAFRAGGESPNDPTYLLASESVQKELGLTADQKASFEKLRGDENHPFFGKLAGLSQDQIQSKLEQHAKGNRDRISKILTPQQNERLNEINVQMVGAVALSFDDVAEKLALTAEQKAKLKNLGEETRRKLTALNATTNGLKREQYKAKLSAITAERKTQALAPLTDEQRAKFTKLQGEKFDTSTVQPNRKNFSRRSQVGGSAPAQFLGQPPTP